MGGTCDVSELCLCVILLRQQVNAKLSAAHILSHDQSLFQLLISVVLHHSGRQTSRLKIGLTAALGPRSRSKTTVGAKVGAEPNAGNVVAPVWFGLVQCSNWLLCSE